MSKLRRLAFCLEMGAGHGHLTGLCAIADQFVRQNHLCSFFVPDKKGLLRVRPNWIELSNVSVADSAPWIVKDPREFQKRTYTLADVLKTFGFVDAETVCDKVRWWDQRLSDLKPDIIVAEFAPGCTLAATGRFPIVTVGNGYSVLPDVSPLPAMTAWSPEVPESSVRTESAITNCMTHSRHVLGRSGLHSLAAAFRGDWNYPCTFQSFDPYRDVRHEPVFVPFNIAIPKRKHDPQAGGKPQGFVYFSFPDPLFQQIIRLVLQQSNYECTIYAPPYTDWALATNGGLGHRITKDPIDFEELSAFSFCLHHGGLGISAAAAIQNVPQLITPVNLEHAITAMGLRQQKAAIVRIGCGCWQNAESLCKSIQETLTLRMDLHEEFARAGQQGSNTLDLIRETIKHTLGFEE